MLASLINKKIQLILLIGYFLVAQLFGYGNNVYKLWLIIPLILFISLEGLTLKVIILMFLPILLLTNLIFENNSNMEGWAFVNIHLCSAIYSILIISNFELKQYLDEKKLSKLIISYGLFIIFSIIFEHFLFFDSPYLGKFLIGSQNLTSLTLIMTVPFAFLYIDNKILKYVYLSIIVVAVGFLVKSRGLSIILTTVILIYTINDLRGFSRKVRYGLITLALITIFALLALLNDRVIDLIYGNSIYFRLLSWLRFIESILQSNIIFGVGPSNVTVIFNKFQDIYPHIFLVAGDNTFTNPHADWIHIFVSSGIVGLFPYFLINGFLIFKFVGFSRTSSFNNLTKAIFTCYIVLLISAQYDITNATFNTLVIFYMTQAYLLKQFIIEDKSFINKYFLSIVFGILLAFTIYNQSKSYNLLAKGNEYSLNIIKLKVFDNNFEKISPHFGYVDTLKSYHYLNTSKENFNEKIFEELILKSRKYNKYFEPSLHLSFQFFSYKNDSQEILKVLSDVFYSIIINEKISNIGNEPKNIQVVIGDSLSYELKEKKHLITLTPSVIDTIMRSGRNIGTIQDFKVIESKFLFVADNSNDVVMLKKVLKTLLSKLSNFSMPLDLEP